METMTREEEIREFIANQFKEMIYRGDVKSISPYADEWERSNPEWVAFVNRYLNAVKSLLPMEEGK